MNFLQERCLCVSTYVPPDPSAVEDLLTFLCLAKHYSLFKRHLLCEVCPGPKVGSVS